MFGGIGMLLLHPLMSVLGADAAVPATGAYVTVVLAFVPVLAAAVCPEQLARAEGAARQAMIGLMHRRVANVVFDALFFLVLNWCVAGAALLWAAYTGGGPRLDSLDGDTAERVDHLHFERSSRSRCTRP